MLNMDGIKTWVLVTWNGAIGYAVLTLHNLNKILSGILLLVSIALTVMKFIKVRREWQELLKPGGGGDEL